MDQRERDDLPRRPLMSSAAVGALGAVALAGYTSGSGDSEDREPWRALGTAPQPVHASRLEREKLPPGR